MCQLLIYFNLSFPVTLILFSRAQNDLRYVYVEMHVCQAYTIKFMKLFT